MSDIRKMMNLFEAREKSEEVSYSEKLKAKKVEKVIATLSGNKEKEFSDLAKKLFEAKTKLDEIKKLEAQIKGEAREAIASLFDTEDEAYTRLVEVSDFSLQLAKKSEPTVTVKYASVLEELKNHLTPDLIKILNGLEWKFRSVSEKESALKITPKVSIKESENEDFYDKLEDFADRYHDAVVAKLTSFDSELKNLKRISLNENDKMSISSKISSISSINDEEESLKIFKEILKEINKENAILNIYEYFEEEEHAEIFGSMSFVIDLSKIDNLLSSWRYIKNIFIQILKGLEKGNTRITYHASHKYSFIDTLDEEEINMVKPNTISGKEIIDVDGILNY